MQRHVLVDGVVGEQGGRRSGVARREGLAEAMADLGDPARRIAHVVVEIGGILRTDTVLGAGAVSVPVVHPADDVSLFVEAHGAKDPQLIAEQLGGVGEGDEGAPAVAQDPYRIGEGGRRGLGQEAGEGLVE